MQWTLTFDESTDMQKVERYIRTMTKECSVVSNTTLRCQVEYCVHYEQERIIKYCIKNSLIDFDFNNDTRSFSAWLIFNNVGCSDDDVTYITNNIMNGAFKFPSSNSILKLLNKVSFEFSYRSLRMISNAIALYQLQKAKNFKYALVIPSYIEKGVDLYFPVIDNNDNLMKCIISFATKSDVILAKLKHDTTYKISEYIDILEMEM